MIIEGINWMKFEEQFGWGRSTNAFRIMCGIILIINP